jgi:hypothetical protein
MICGPMEPLNSRAPEQEEMGGAAKPNTVSLHELGPRERQSVEILFGESSDEK